MGQRQYFSAQTRTRACVISRCGATGGGGGGGGGGGASLWSFVLLYNGSDVMSRKGEYLLIIPYLVCLSQF